MIYELRLFKGNAIHHQADKVVKFTHHGCNGNPIQHADRLAIYKGNFQSMELLERHFYGRESTRNYGWGIGYEPIIVGSV